MRTEVVEEGASVSVVVEAVVEPLLLLFALARRAELRVTRGMVFVFSLNRFR